MDVIICSGNPAVVDAVSRALGDEGHRPTVFPSGLEVLGAVGVLASDLVVLDLETPGLSTFLLISAIRELAPELPIVAVSTKPQADGRALSQKGVPFVTLGSRPAGEAYALLAEAARLGRAGAVAGPGRTDPARGAGNLGKDGRREMVTEQGVLGALATIMDPDLHRDIVSLGFVKDVQIDGGKVAFTIELTTPACPVRRQLEEGARQAVAALPEVEQVEVTMTSCVTTSRSPRSNYLPGVRNTVAVGSGKGGVGKSTVAANLAVSLSRAGARVGLMDADVYGPCIPKLMGVADALQHTEDGRVIPPQEHGVKIMSMGFLLPKDEAVIWRGPMLHKMIQEFLGRVEWGELDYLVIDLPPGTGDIQLSLCQTIPLTGAVIVSTPQDVALEVAAKAILMFNKLKVPILGIIENMSYHTCSHCGRREDIFGHGGAREASEKTEIPFLGEVPLDATIRVQSDAGRPVALGSDDSPAARPFLEIAGRLAARISIANAAGLETEPVVMLK